ncbi:TPA: hypothetical protein ACOJRH_001288 [Vibrio harveyi]|uniref:hypothetical protein n=1 Tax=Vibrio harveyi TaxID=669 RepID=UPI003908E526
MLLKAPSLINHVVTTKVNERLNKLEEMSNVSFNKRWVEEKTSIKLAKVYNLTIVNVTVLDGSDNDVVAEIVGSIIENILDGKEDNIPYPLP